MNCLRCDRPQGSCLCNLCQEVDNHTDILILQHIRESRHRLGTVRIAMITFNRVKRFIVWKKLDKPDCLSPNAALLYPGPSARQLEELTPMERPDQLIVLDGTWPQARALLRENPWLQELPRVSLAPQKPSSYTFRKEPSAHCLSTVESIVAALRILEPETPNLENPIQVFEEMVRRQVAYSPTQETV